METTVPLIDAIVNNALFHSNSHTNQMLHQIIHILCFFWLIRYPRFLMKYIKVNAVQWPEIWELLRVSYIIALTGRRQ